jgi:hypothetical protein
MCSVIGHYRNRHRARFKLGRWRSNCLLCGQQMIRVAPGLWSLATESPHIALTGETPPWRPARRRCRCDYMEPDRTHWVLRDLLEPERETE